jgi:hypothetical protein
MTTVESCPEPDDEISQLQTDFDEQVTYLDAVRNAKSFDKVVRRDGRPVAVDGYYSAPEGKTGGRSPFSLPANWSSSAALPLLSDNTQRPKAGRTSGSLAQRSALTGDMIVRLSTGSTRGGFGGTGVGIEIPEVGEGREIGDEKVA